MEFLLDNHLKTAARRSLKPEMYLRSCQTSKIEDFVKKSAAKAVNYFHKKTLSQMFYKLINTRLKIAMF